MILDFGTKNAVIFGVEICGLLFFYFGGFKFEACFVLGGPKISSNEHPCPNLCRLLPMGR